MKKIIVADLPVFIVKNKIKKMYLKIKGPDGDVHVSAPLSMSDQHIVQLIIRKMEWIKEKQALVRTRKGPLQLSEWNEKQKSEAIEYLQKEIPFYLEKWQMILGVSVEKVYLKLMKSRWGSCTPKKNKITLNIALAKKDAEVLEYIIVHELLHFFEMKHNKNFYRLMDQYLPAWKKIKKKL